MNANLDQANASSAAGALTMGHMHRGDGKDKPAKPVDSGVLKDVMKELSKDGEFTKGDMKVLSLFIDVLKALGDLRDTSQQAGGGVSTSKAAPASVGGGSQAPPAAAPATPAAPNAPAAPAAPAAPVAGAPAAPAAPTTPAFNAAPAAPAAEAGAATTLKSMVDGALSDGKLDKNEMQAIGKFLAKMTGGDFAADLLNSASKASESTKSGEPADAASASKPAPVKETKSEEAGSNSKPADMAAPSKPTESVTKPAQPSSTTTSTAPSLSEGQKRATYDALKQAAMSDGAVTPNERAALDAAAKKLGITEAAPPSLGQTLKDVLASAMKDGTINENESKAIGSLVGKMGGSAQSLSQGDVMKMLTDVMSGTSADGSFSDQDLATFDKVLSLVDGAAASGGGASQSAAPAQGNTTTPSRDSGINASTVANYMFSTFMGKDGTNGILKKLDDAKQQANGASSS